MPARAAELHPEAIEDIRGAYDWYASRNALAATAFLTEIENAIAAVVARPDVWPRHLHGTRRFLLRRFPYSIVYRTKPSNLEVIAVAHARRRPGFWRAR